MPLKTCLPTSTAVSSPHPMASLRRQAAPTTLTTPSTILKPTLWPTPMLMLRPTLNSNADTQSNACTESEAKATPDNNADANDNDNEQDNCVHYYMANIEDKVKKARNKGVTVGTFPTLLAPRAVTINWFRAWESTSCCGCTACQKKGLKCKRTNLLTYKCYQCFCSNRDCSIAKKIQAGQVHACAYALAVKNNLTPIPMDTMWRNCDFQPAASKNGLPRNSNMATSDTSHRKRGIIVPVLPIFIYNIGVSEERQRVRSI
ncbi:hypothetical protein C8Q74DRAFT_1222761 [Fomes fomentarius]|nr:hypothetical protein C8Q74DRAFT_1222761 [Fomes fomentarius]